MNGLNRVLVVALLLLAIPLCTILLIFPQQATDTVIGWLSSLLTTLEGIQWYVRGPLGIVAALVVDAGLILWLYFELRRPKNKPIRIKKATGGTVTLGVSSIGERLTYDLDQLPGVLRVRSHVSTRRDGVLVELDLDIATGINVPEEASRVVEVVQRVVEEDLGLKLARPPKVNLHTIAKPKGKKTPSAQEAKPDSAVAPLSYGSANDSDT
jgi:uncharacterized alkaline shock family protein YloU